MLAAASYGCREIGKQYENWKDERKRKKENANKDWIKPIIREATPDVRTQETWSESISSTIHKLKLQYDDKQNLIDDSQIVLAYFRSNPDSEHRDVFCKYGIKLTIPKQDSAKAFLELCIFKDNSTKMGETVFWEGSKQEALSLLYFCSPEWVAKIQNGLMSLIQNSLN